MSNKIIGNPTATPVKLPDVDQTYNSESQNAQSGKAVAEALSKVDLSEYYTKEETDDKISIFRQADQTYSSESENPQSGKAVAEAIAGAVTPLWQPNTEYKVGDRVSFETKSNGLFIGGTAICKEQHISEDAYSDIYSGEYGYWDIVRVSSASVADKAITAYKDMDGEYFYKKFEAPERLVYYGDSNITPTDESFFKFTFDNEKMTASVVLSDSAKESVVDANIVIPYKCADKYKVTSIGDNAFKGVSIGSLIIPNSITSIGNNAFRDFIAADGVTIPKSVNSVSGSLFPNDMGMNIICCEKDSWISSYAQKNGISVQYVNKATESYVDEKLGDVERLLKNI